MMLNFQHSSPFVKFKSMLAQFIIAPQKGSRFSPSNHGEFIH